MTNLIKPGDRSPEVADVQARLRALGMPVDDSPGWFGDSTKRAVRTFQQGRGILVDGIVGPGTWGELVGASRRLGDAILYLKQPPMRGDDVALLQERLSALGFDAGRSDGIFGDATDSAVRAFQKEYGVAEDGMFGPMSHLALMGLRIDRQGTSAGLREELRRVERGGLGGTVVIIDPGHGGPNRGNLGTNGVCEADLCWQLALEVAERLAAAGATARLTRTETADPDNSERARRANHLGGEVFLSLHLNTYEEPTAEGSSTYYFTASHSARRLAEEIQGELVGLGLNDCRSHGRSYAVLKETRMPAVLVEPVFITNPDEAKKLQDREFLKTVAQAIVAGVESYSSDLG
ncbi:MAG: N-acetylmuramoyl-L-alanine amidase [Actinomycetota bacterium]|nr:N-acetylmuramoyl-L-alanine amidase [Actinomycetota bacterium]